MALLTVRLMLCVACFTARGLTRALSKSASSSQERATALPPCLAPSDGNVGVSLCCQCRGFLHDANRLAHDLESIRTSSPLSTRVSCGIRPGFTSIDASRAPGVLSFC